MRLIAVGDNVVDYYEDREEMFPGGNAVNVAIFWKRYGVDEVSYIGIVGNDEEGEHIVSSLEEEQIDVSRVRKVFGASGEAVVTLDEQGDRKFVGSNKGGVQTQVKLNFTETELAFISTFSLLHTSVFSHLEKELPMLQEYIDISFDFSTKYDDDYLELVCPYIKYATFSGGDLTSEECEALIARVHQLGTPNIIVTRGSAGSLFSDSKQVYQQGIIETDVVDTLGAGDTFVAIFLKEYVSHGDTQVAMEKGAAAAAETCQRYGAFGYGKKRGKRITIG
ncbi:PfkB family carbohydrate kinase [Neobacillus drentensis]|uniref:PfkB family carbohydrate kinase n=1 Tax=Neobacillus drentensis TaxID=220684 RepID=UPI001F24C3E0|nr:PfkB family carbohydrate kinase [Neobacillus drentensis]ULT56894.1 PfkB family carbohydrate kinase [Neobacillus drentensis]